MRLAGVFASSFICKKKRLDKLARFGYTLGMEQVINPTKGQIQACQYIENTGGLPTIEHFDDDFEPIGPSLRKQLVVHELCREIDGRLENTPEGYALATFGRLSVKEV